MSKKLLQGKIKWINFNPTDQEDNYGNSIRRDFVLESGERIGFPKGKVEEISVSEGKGKPRYVLKVGDTVAVAAEENGKYLNAKLADITVLEKGGGSGTTPAGNTSRVSQGRTGGSSGTSNSSGPDWAKKDAGAAASADVEKAIQIAIALGEDLTDESVLLSLADTVHKVVSTHRNRIIGEFGGMPEEDQKPTRAVSKKRAPPKVIEAPDDSEEPDDDIPF